MAPPCATGQGFRVRLEFFPGVGSYQRLYPFRDTPHGSLLQGHVRRLRVPGRGNTQDLHQRCGRNRPFHGRVGCRRARLHRVPPWLDRRVGVVPGVVPRQLVEREHAAK